MNRSPLTITLAIISALLIVVGRVNHDASWGDVVFVAGIAVLVVAALLSFRTRR